MCPAMEELEREFDRVVEGMMRVTVNTANLRYVRWYLQLKTILSSFIVSSK